jgi:hypothetical protein
MTKRPDPVVAAPGPSSWATRGRALAERLAALAAQRRADDQASQALRGVDEATIRARFTALAAHMTECLDAWSRAAGITLDADGDATRLRVVTPGALLDCRLQIAPGTAVVTIRGNGRGSEHTVPLDAADFDGQGEAAAAVHEFVGHAEAAALVQREDDNAVAR